MNSYVWIANFLMTLGSVAMAILPRQCAVYGAMVCVGSGMLYGYAGCLLLALMVPISFWVMIDPQLTQWKAERANWWYVPFLWVVSGVLSALWTLSFCPVMWPVQSVRHLVARLIYDRPMVLYLFLCVLYTVCLGVWRPMARKG